jgi:tellurite resistance protein TerC
MMDSLMMWTLFCVVVVLMLVIDMKVFQKKDGQANFKEAVVWSIVWVIVAFVFGAFVYWHMGSYHGMKFMTGYLIERALSMDNLFVFLLIFAYFNVPPEDQRKALFWGIIGALVFRALFIVAGVALIRNLSWTLYLFGAFLVYTGIKLAFEKKKEIHPEKNPILKLVRKFIPVSDDYAAGRFFVVKNGVRMATPLFVTLIVIETSDVVFATDSIPAILGITLDPFIVYSSNIFAILGLRAMYFVIAGLMSMFRFLNVGLSLILVIIGAKMLAKHFIHLPVALELSIVAGVLLLSIILSVIFPKPADAVEKQ